MKQTLAITRKELDIYFGSPMALIFVAIFLVAVLFSFFWVSGFFGRGVADVRPLFQWMPLLLILLIATLTMRQWSEEQQTGTLEVLLTLPVRLSQYVIGKFLAVLLLVCAALVLTLSLPVSVGLLGSLDSGPVFGGYLAAVLMACAYIAIGLFVSSRTDNQIVALLITGIVCGLFYLVGSPAITGLASVNVAEVLAALGTGSRFESIERGVIDLRDLVYYLALMFIFLTLNILSLESKRWSSGPQTRNFRFNRRLAAVLLIANLVMVNFVIGGVTVRADLTQNGDFTLSTTTTDLLNNLQEPLLIRGYFSQETHPLLAPLIPYVRDLLEEYKAAGNGKIQLDFVDPITNPQLEQEANQTYGIKPTPLQANDRGKTSVVNAYLSILIRYGDQNVVLNLLDMIDAQNVGGTVNVRLRNPEYDLTSSIQKVVYGFQSAQAVLASLKDPAQLTLYVTPDTLPQELQQAPATITTVVNTLVKQSNGKLTFKSVNVSSPNAGISAQTLHDKYQIDPIDAGFLSSDTYYLHMVIEADGQAQVIYPTGDISQTAIQTSIESTLERFSAGALQTVGLWAPPGSLDQSGQSLEQFFSLQQSLSKNYNVKTIDLTTGQIGSDINALVIIGPQDLTDVARYAIDQFLMRGGPVFVAAGNYQITVDQTGNLSLQAVSNGLQSLLGSYGITVEPKLVMDTQNTLFPVSTQRSVGGVLVNDTQAVNYPYFIDLRSNEMAPKNPVVAGLTAMTLNFASPLTLDQTKLKGDTVTTLLQSSPKAWTSTNTSPQPDYSTYPDVGFPVEGTQSAQTLAVSVEGSFVSYFTGKPSPFATTATPNPGATATPIPATTAGAAASFIAKSPNTARLVVVGSTEFLNDALFNVSRQVNVDRSANNLQLVQNSVDWFVADTALSSIRAKGADTRLLNPLSADEQTRWEIGNYVFALLAVVGLGIIWQLQKRNEKPMRLAPRRTV